MNKQVIILTTVISIMCLIVLVEPFVYLGMRMDVQESGVTHKFPEFLKLLLGKESQ